jgi:dehydrogenase/reductase SDR family protein 12
VDGAYGDKAKYLEPFRTLWEGSEAIAWLTTTPRKNLESGAFYLDRSPQRKHIAGLFMTDGSFTKNSEEEVDAMMKKLEECVGV